MGLTTLDTAANFVTVRFDDAAKVEMELARRGLLVRHLANYNLPDWLRITVGMPTDQARLIEALKEIVSAAPRQ
jgi:histidinol-phosphate aminotransferase